MSKIKPIIDIEAGSETIWSILAHHIDRGLPIFKGMISEVKKRYEVVGHGDLAERAMIQTRLMELLQSYFSQYEISVA